MCVAVDRASLVAYQREDAMSEALKGMLATAVLLVSASAIAQTPPLTAEQKECWGLQLMLERGNKLTPQQEETWKRCGLPPRSGGRAPYSTPGTAETANTAHKPGTRRQPAWSRSSEMAPVGRQPTASIASTLTRTAAGTLIAAPGKHLAPRRASSTDRAWPPPATGGWSRCQAIQTRLP
jgi:hypothetical protein